ncbi:MAG TPA: hypothetical protein VLE19_07215, partial [Pyrinomonadaceae bacterium]|nr:hypothetical protein [Pyrinomonadaceae bacterium]
NRPGILIETHMIKDYRSRVIGTYDFLRSALDEVNRDHTRLCELGRRADAEAVQLADRNEEFPLDFRLTDEVTPLQLKAFSYKTEPSEISGDLRVVFGREPLDLTVPMYQTFEATATVTPPDAYIVPVQWQNVIEVIKAHGLQVTELTTNSRIEIQSYRFTNVTWPSSPFEGRHMPAFDVEVTTEQRDFLAGSVVLPMRQPLARLALNLLEPKAPDSFVRWGFFNAVFEEKEYAEHYVLEDLARDMMASDPRLKVEFEKQLASDTAFASNSAERLRFFYRRSPYWDSQMNLYPVGRILR